ncbi:MAG: hypothetical protein ACNYPI_11295 [Arenicellales bacterium WSBS_2016_MAG_OTU3]
MQSRAAVAAENALLQQRLAGFFSPVKPSTTPDRIFDRPSVSSVRLCKPEGFVSPEACKPDY